MKCQVVLDDLAKPRGNNKSFVVREALKVYAAMEAVLDDVERRPQFRKMMESALDDLRHGRVRPHGDAERIVRRKPK